MLEIYLKTCNFYVAKNKFDMEYGQKKRFTTAEPELVLLDIVNPEVQKHLDMGVYRGEGFDSLWKFLKGTKHTDMENNLLCFSELRESAEAGRRIYLFDHYAGSSERYEYLYKERKEPELCWKLVIKYTITRRLTLKKMGELFPENKVILYAKQHHLLSDAMLKALSRAK